MARINRSHRNRLPLVVAATAAISTLVGSAFAADPAAAAGASGGVRQTITCAKTPTGRTSCPAAHLALAHIAPATAGDQSIVTSAVSNPAALVDTRTWTSGGGNTFPGADVPFGMVQWSPDTSPNRNAGGGYNFGDSALTGYSLTHLSGPGCGAAGDIPILPLTGPLPSGDPGSYQTSFSNTAEVAQAGYYSAESNLPQTITSQFTATPHSSMGRFTFPKTSQADFLVKLLGSQNGDSASSAQVVGNNEISGSAASGGFCGDPDAAYTVYFDITFDHPFTASQVITERRTAGPELGLS